MEPRTSLAFTFSFLKFICCAAVCAITLSSAQAYQVTISGSAQYVDSRDLGVGGTTFYNPFAGPTSKAHEVMLGGTTFTSNERWSAQSMAAADLKTGELKILAGATGAGFASAAARMVEDVTLIGNYNSTTFDGAACYAIPMQFAVNGTLRGNGLVSAGITLGAGTLGIEMHQQVVSGNTIIFSGIVKTLGRLHLDMYLNTDGYISNGVADFYKTAQFTWQLPDSVTFISSSSAFMHTPEPTTICILSCGLLAVARMRKK